METARRKKELTTPTGLVIQFKHEKGSWPQEIYKRGEKVEITIARRTHCIIKSGETIVASGLALCSPTDNFEYELGRQYALNEAKKALTRNQRVEVMQTYLGREGAQAWRLDVKGHAKPQLTRQQTDRVADAAINGALSAIFG